MNIKNTTFSYKILYKTLRDVYTFKIPTVRNISYIQLKCGTGEKEIQGHDQL